MKKLFLIPVLLVGFGFMPGLTHADGGTVTNTTYSTQTKVLTKADIETLKPQLQSLFEAISTTLTSVKEKMEDQNKVLSDYSNVLGDLSTRLGNNPPPSNADLQEIGNTLSKTQAELSVIANWREQVRVTTNNISQFLSTISTAINSAV